MLNSTAAGELASPALVGTGGRSRWSRAKGAIASGLCLVPAAYCAAIVLFALANARDFASATPQLMRYVLVPGLIASGLTFVAFRSSRMTRVNVGGVACALLAALFMSEAMLTSRYIAATKKMLASSSVAGPETGEADQALPPGWGVKRLNRLMGTTRLSHAVLGHTPGAVVNLCRSGGGPIAYRADRFGFRNPARSSAHRPHLMLGGDSFVEGICLPEVVDLAGQVRDRSETFISLGMRGAGPLLELAMIGRYGPVIRPETTVIAFY